MDKIKVFEETQISPPPGSVPPTSLPCTCFDLPFLSAHPVQLLVFYQSSQPKTILPNLKHSLSLALKYYYPLAGNLKWPPESTRPELVYNDGDSVALTVAEYELDFDDLSDSRSQEINVFAPLYARLRDVITCSSEKLIPLTAFQITFFGDRGICIGITSSHIVADGKTMFSFIKAWAFLYTSGASSINDFSLPFYDRSNILKGLEKNETALLSLLKASKVSNDNFHTIINSENVVQMSAVQATFTMSRHRIQRIKHWVSASIRNEPSLHLSSFSVTCAYTWVCFIKARCGQTGDESSPRGDATEHLILPVDIRARLVSPVPLTYFGNCGAFMEVKARTSELLGEEGIVRAVKLIGKGIQNLDVYGELEKYTYYSSLPPEQILSIGGFPKFGAYETDFGWGKPKRVITSTFGDGVTCMYLNDCPNEEGGIEIGFVGNPIEVEAFASAFANSLWVSRCTFNDLDLVS